jgi:hypothetical protein
MKRNFSSKLTKFYFEFSFLVSATITVFWEVTSYSLADWYNVSDVSVVPFELGRLGQQVSL